MQCTQLLALLFVVNFIHYICKQSTWFIVSFKNSKIGKLNTYHYIDHDELVSFLGIGGRNVLLGVLGFLLALLLFFLLVLRVVLNNELFIQEY